MCEALICNIWAQDFVVILMKKIIISNRRICYHLHVIEAGLSTKLLFNFVVSSQLCLVEYRKEIWLFFKLIDSIYKMPVFIPFLSLPNQKFQTHFFKKPS